MIFNRFQIQVYIHEIYDVPWSKTELDMRFEVNDDDIDFRFAVFCYIFYITSTVCNDNFFSKVPKFSGT